MPFDALLSGRLRWHWMRFVPVSVHGCPSGMQSNYARR
ncbi:hypothetical protein [Azospirillum melinis]